MHAGWASVLAGHDAAFAALVTRYQGPLLRLARNFVRDASLAEDVVQDTWIGSCAARSSKGRSCLFVGSEFLREHGSGALTVFGGSQAMVSDCTQAVAGGVRLGVTGYYRLSDDPPHTTLFPDSRFYAYASFDKGKAYGLEIKANVPRIPSLGLSGYLNYALGRVWFYNPITAGFTIEAAHLSETSRLRAPMDQTHTLTGGLTYHDNRGRFWTGVAWNTEAGHLGTTKTMTTGMRTATPTSTQPDPDSAGPAARRTSPGTSPSAGTPSWLGTSIGWRFSSTFRTCRTRCT